VDVAGAWKCWPRYIPALKKLLDSRFSIGLLNLDKIAFYIFSCQVISRLEIHEISQSFCPM